MAHLSPVDQYLMRRPANQRAALEQLRRAIRSAVPDSTETIKSGVPAFRYHGRPLVSIGAGRGHVALYIMYGDVLRAHAGDLSGFDTSKTVIRFTPERPLPNALVTELIKARRSEIDDQTRRSGANRHMTSG